MFGQNISIPLLSKNRNSSAVLLKSAISENFGFVRDSANEVNRKPQNVESSDFETSSTPPLK